MIAAAAVLVGSVLLADIPGEGWTNSQVGTALGRLTTINNGVGTLNENIAGNTEILAEMQVSLVSVESAAWWCAWACWIGVGFMLYQDLQPRVITLWPSREDRS
jgi:hypothetical protein